MNANLVFFCGCGLSRTNDIVQRVWFCEDHNSLFSPDKTLNEMANDLGAVARGEHSPTPLEVQQRQIKQTSVEDELTAVYPYHPGESWQTKDDSEPTTRILSAEESASIIAELETRVLDPDEDSFDAHLLRMLKSNQVGVRTMKVYELEFESTYKIAPDSNDTDTSYFTHYVAASDFEAVVEYVKKYRDKCRGVPVLLSARELGHLYGLTEL